MSLYSVEDKMQKAIGIRPYWKLFKTIQGSPLHLLIKHSIEERMQSEKTINSRLFGKQLLEEEQDKLKEYCTTFSKQQISSLYGMILWNTLANHEEKWRFYKEPKSSPEASSAVLYFRQTQ
jgi:hypothetical protein